MKYEGDSGLGMSFQGEQRKISRVARHKSQAMLAMARAARRGVMFSTMRHWGVYRQRFALCIWLMYVLLGQFT